MYVFIGILEIRKLYRICLHGNVVCLQQLQSFDRKFKTTFKINGIYKLYIVNITLHGFVINLYLVILRLICQTQSIYHVKPKTKHHMNTEYICIHMVIQRQQQIMPLLKTTICVTVPALKLSPYVLKTNKAMMYCNYTCNLVQKLKCNISTLKTKSVFIFKRSMFKMSLNYS